jgi:hypothetical protein
MKRFVTMTALTCLLLACSEENKAPNRSQIYALTKAANDSSLQGHVLKNVDQITEVYTTNAIVYR